MHWSANLKHTIVQLCILPAPMAKEASLLFSRPRSELVHEHPRQELGPVASQEAHTNATLDLGVTRFRRRYLRMGWSEDMPCLRSYEAPLDSCIDLILLALQVGIFSVIKCLSNLSAADSVKYTFVCINLLTRQIYQDFTAH